MVIHNTNKESALFNIHKGLEQPPYYLIPLNGHSGKFDELLFFSPEPIKLMTME